jgi:hypothetical protein
VYDPMQNESMPYKDVDPKTHIIFVHVAQLLRLH